MTYENNPTKTISEKKSEYSGVKRQDDEVLNPGGHHTEKNYEIASTSLGL